MCKNRLLVFLHSNPEYKDTPMDIAQLPNLPEKTSESSETSDSESESKENSGRWKKNRSVTYHQEVNVLLRKTKTDGDESRNVALERNKFINR